MAVDQRRPLSQAARTVGSPQIRNAGTLGGNLGTSSPAGDGLPVLSALGAEIEVASAAGRRRLPFGEFMVGVKRTALAPGELVVSVTLPVVDGWQGYAKVGVRNAMVIAVASAWKWRSACARCSSAAAISSRNSGWGRSGRLLNSGCACVATQKG